MDSRTHRRGSAAAAIYEMADLWPTREERVGGDAVRPCRRPPTCWAGSAAAGSRSWRGTARVTGCCPPELNFRANVYGFKVLGVEWIVSASAVGSLQERYRPEEILVPDQFLDRTRGRISTFFGDGLVAHVSFAHPVCPALSALAAEAGDAAGASVHRGGTYVCMEGPQFSTLAESRLYRSWGMDVIGMTNLQEAKLAREAEICFTTLALVTDYDCWHPDHDNVSVEMVVETLRHNAETARRVIRGIVGRLPIERGCECRTALATAIITRPEAVSEQARRALAPIVGKYLA